MRVVISVLALSVTCMCAAPAGAQDNGPVGLVIGYPASVGIIWRIADRIAIRPDVEFGGGSSDLSPGLGGTSSTTSSHVAVGVSGLFYAAKWDALRAYVAPRLTYTRATATSESSIPSISFPGLTPITTTTSTTSTGNTEGFGGSFGAQYSMHRKFSAFAEVGLAYRHSTSKSRTSSSNPFTTLQDLRPVSNSWGTAAGAGFIFHF